MTALPPAESKTWSAAIMMAVAMILIGCLPFFTGHPWIGILFFLSAFGIGYWNSPLRRNPHTPFTEAMQRNDLQHAIVFWRPGCPACARLQSAVRSAHPEIIWVNIWQDAEAAAHLRSIQDGNEIVPTAIIGSTIITDPKLSVINACLDAAKAELGE